MTSYDQSVRDIEAALVLGIEAEGGNYRAVAAITPSQVRWIAAWLAGEGIGKLPELPSRTTMQPHVRPGQIWADNDPRSEGRTLQVLAIEEGRALCAVRTNPNWVQEWIDKSGDSRNPPSDRRGANTRINLKRFDGTSRGYKLVRGETQ